VFTARHDLNICVFKVLAGLVLNLRRFRYSAKGTYQVEYRYIYRTLHAFVDFTEHPIEYSALLVRNRVVSSSTFRPKTP